MNIIPIQLSMGKCYLVPFSGGYLQVDTGYDRDYPAYRRALQKAGIALAEIKYLFLTHHHDDHAGFLNDLTRDTPLTIIANHFAKDLLLTGKNDTTRGGGWVSPLTRTLVETMMRLKPHWTLTFPPFALRDRDLLIQGDDCVTLPSMDIPGTILYTPGHSIDHQVLGLESGEVFCGDAAASMLLFAGTHHCTVFMTDMDAAYQSWQKILAAGTRLIYPAHGRPFLAADLSREIGKIRTESLIPLKG